MHENVSISIQAEVQLRQGGVNQSCIRARRDVKHKRGSKIERCHVRVPHLLISFLLILSTKVTEHGGHAHTVG